MSVRLLAALFAAVAVLLVVLATAQSGGSDFLREDTGRRLRALFGALIATTFPQANEDPWDERSGLRSRAARRIIPAAALLGALCGLLLLGPAAALGGAVAAPLLIRQLQRRRLRRYAQRIDDGAADLALALASALAAGRSVRGALLTAGAVVPEPLAAQLRRTAVDLTLGRSTSEALGSLRRRTGSKRIESLTGAITLQRASGGDLVRLMRELAEAFRERDRARRDARSASAQARYTAIVVAVIPLFAALMIELATGGAASAALRLLPTAVMIGVAVALIATGVALSQRLAAVGE